MPTAPLNGPHDESHRTEVPDDLYPKRGARVNWVTYREPLVDQLIALVARRAGLTPAQARAAVLAVLDFLTAGLPSPVVGRIHELLRSAPPPVPGQNRRQNDLPP